MCIYYNRHLHLQLNILKPAVSCTLTNSCDELWLTMGRQQRAGNSILFLFSPKIEKIENIIFFVTKQLLQEFWGQKQAKWTILYHLSRWKSLFWRASTFGRRAHFVWFDPVNSVKKCFETFPALICQWKWHEFAD